MNDLLTPPADRDLPPGRAARMRAGLLTAAAGPRPQRPRWKLVVPVAAALTLIAAAAVTLEVRGEDRTRILAMTPGELNLSLREAAQECLEWQDPSRYDPFHRPDLVPVTMGDISVASRQGGRIAILFLNNQGYFACDLTVEDGKENSGGFTSDDWKSREWMPGPVQRLSLSSSDFDGGAVTVLGRVSPRVHRLILDHGNGRTTTARLANGTFGLVTRTKDVQSRAELVAYDAAGQEISRQRLFRRGPDETCYTDPAGRVVNGKAGPNCQPADPWRR